MANIILLIHSGLFLKLRLLRNSCGSRINTTRSTPGVCPLTYAAAANLSCLSSFSLPPDNQTVSLHFNPFLRLLLSKFRVHTLRVIEISEDRQMCSERDVKHGVVSRSESQSLCVVSSPTLSVMDDVDL
nr:hypothetical protein Iba_chr01aCG8050 [Ipomoea batatas]